MLAPSSAAPLPSDRVVSPEDRELNVSAPGPTRGRRAERSRLGRVPLRVLLTSGRFGVVGLLGYVLLFNLSVVRGSSMAPGIHDGDRIVVETWSYVFGGVDRGDVVVLRYPLDPRIDYIKRVVGLPGDRITCAGDQLWVNGVRYEEPYVEFPDSSCYFSVTVEPDHFFVLGDNRKRSSDSRDFGQVPAEYVRGRVDLRLWPIDRAGWVD